MIDVRPGVQQVQGSVNRLVHRFPCLVSPCVCVFIFGNAIFVSGRRWTMKLIHAAPPCRMSNMTIKCSILSGRQALRAFTSYYSYCATRMSLLLLSCTNCKIITGMRVFRPSPAAEDARSACEPLPRRSRCAAGGEARV